VECGVVGEGLLVAAQQSPTMRRYQLWRGSIVAKKARIKGKVEYREGDGQSMPIPQGPCEIEETELDVTISWVDGDTHGSTAIPLSDFRRFVAKGEIEVFE
jgi:hypothetical protein